jgi:hypothetical protein
VLSFRDQVRTLSELLDREIELREPTRSQAAQQMGSHVPAPFVPAVLDYWAQSPGELIEATCCAERITGRPSRTFRQWANPDRYLALDWLGKVEVVDLDHARPQHARCAHDTSPVSHAIGSE